MNTLRVCSQLEGNEDLHLARLLILLGVFAGRDGSGVVDGLTKLAKLDFLLRYPTYLERALPRRNARAEDAKVAEHERKSIESRMVRFRFGPWDHRYRRFLNVLVARGLAHVTTEGRTIKIGLTPAGVHLAAQIGADPAFADMTARARVLRRDFDLAATTLMRFVYDTFPEIGTLRYNEEIG